MKSFFCIPKKCGICDKQPGQPPLTNAYTEKQANMVAKVAEQDLEL